MVRNTLLHALVAIMLAALVSLSFFLTPLQAQHQRRMVAEWEPALGTLIRWPLGIPSSLVVELASDDQLFVLVRNQSQKNQATNTFTSWGVNMTNVTFIFAPTYSHWTRDWGPHYVFDETGVGGIADPVFDGYPWVPGCFTDAPEKPPLPKNRKSSKGYEEDDAVNIILAESFNCPLIPLPVYLTGGNIMADGHGTAISTQQMLDENYPACDEACFRQLMKDSLGLFNYIIADNPEIQGIQHIDCYAKYLDEETILVKEVPAWHPEYTCAEDLASFLAGQTSCYGRPYNIVRIFCGSYGGNNVAAYTNSLILNKKVLVPLFNISTDQQALDTYAEAMPGYEVIGFPWGSWYYYDALHCRTMGIFDREMLRITHKSLQGEVQAGQGIGIVAMIDDRSEAGLIPGELLLHWREQNDLTWNLSTFVAAAGQDTFAAPLPPQIPGKTIEYYISVADSSGRAATLPRAAPEALFSFITIDTVTGVYYTMAATISLTVFPTLFNDHIRIFLEAGNVVRCSLRVMDGFGREVVRLFEGVAPAGKIAVTWNGRAYNGVECRPGIYFIVLETPADIHVARCFLVE